LLKSDSGLQQSWDSNEEDGGAFAEGSNNCTRGEGVVLLYANLGILQEV